MKHIATVFFKTETRARDFCEIEKRNQTESERQEHPVYYKKWDRDFFVAYYWTY